MNYPKKKKNLSSKLKPQLSQSKCGTIHAGVLNFPTLIDAAWKPRLLTPTNHLDDKLFGNTRILQRGVQMILYCRSGL